MDPTEALRRAREALQAFANARTEVEAIVAATTLAATFDGLDEWLTAGGFLPQQWADARHEVVK